MWTNACIPYTKFTTILQWLCEHHGTNVDKHISILIAPLNNFMKPYPQLEVEKYHGSIEEGLKIQVYQVLYN
jgi:hypothetical protein